MSNTPSPFRRKNRTDTLTFPIDPDDAILIRPAQTRYETAVAALKLTTEPGGVDSAETDSEAREAAEKEVSEAKAALDAVLAEHPTITFHLRALSAAKLQQLQTDHPPTDAQVKSAATTDPNAPAPDHNPETYPPALLSAATTKVEWSDPDLPDADGISDEDAVEFYQDSSFGDQAMIFQVIAMLNQLPSRLETLGKG